MKKTSSQKKVRLPIRKHTIAVLTDKLLLAVDGGKPLVCTEHGSSCIP